MMTTKFASADDADRQPFFKPYPLWIQRVNRVIDELAACGVSKVCDLGCGEGVLVSRLRNDPRFTDIAGVDIEEAALHAAAEECGVRNMDHLEPRNSPLRISLYLGSLTVLEPRLMTVATDAVTLVEVIEHLDPAPLAQLPEIVFGSYTPKVAIVTTPNSEFNVHFPEGGFPPHGFRHLDHRFEWTRNEFQTWCNDIALRFRYEVTFGGIGDEPNHDTRGVGHCTQMAVFRKSIGLSSFSSFSSSSSSSPSLTCLYQLEFPWEPVAATVFRTFLRLISPANVHDEADPLLLRNSMETRPTATPASSSWDLFWSRNSKSPQLQWSSPAATFNPPESTLRLQYAVSASGIWQLLRSVCDARPGFSFEPVDLVRQGYECNELQLVVIAPSETSGQDASNRKLCILESMADVNLLPESVQAGFIALTPHHWDRLCPPWLLPEGDISGDNDDNDDECDDENDVGGDGAQIDRPDTLDDQHTTTHATPGWEIDHAATGRHARSAWTEMESSPPTAAASQHSSGADAHGWRPIAGWSTISNRNIS